MSSRARQQAREALVGQQLGDVELDTLIMVSQGGLVILPVQAEEIHGDSDNNDYF